MDVRAYVWIAGGVGALVLMLVVGAQFGRLLDEPRPAPARLAPAAAPRSVTSAIAAAPAGAGQAASTGQPGSSVTEGLRLESADLAPAADSPGGQIVGIVANGGPRPIGSVTVEFAVCDANGAQIDTAVDRTPALVPGQKWEFRAAFRGGGVRPGSFRLTRLFGS